MFLIALSVTMYYVLVELSCIIIKHYSTKLLMMSNPIKNCILPQIHVEMSLYCNLGRYQKWTGWILILEAMIKTIRSKIYYQNDIKYRTIENEQTIRNQRCINTYILSKTVDILCVKFTIHACYKEKRVNLFNKFVICLYHLFNSYLLNYQLFQKDLIECFCTDANDLKFVNGLTNCLLFLSGSSAVVGYIWHFELK